MATKLFGVFVYCLCCRRTVPVEKAVRVGECYQCLGCVEAPQTP